MPAGKVRVAGIAWAQHTGIAKVEVRLDNGPWREAVLSHEVNVNTGRMWWLGFDVAPGGHQVVCRATGKSGYVQPETRAGTVPGGATGWDSLAFTTR
ncbi:hypothetical protein [Amycolatopsis sp. CA-128772]|uniref:hypothetical protein n=1 Tax=Amycolatopsis sp. CA-128772 TaxID=2073159 RepID=UPI00351A93A7